MPTITVAGIKLPVSSGVASSIAILLALAVGGGLLWKETHDPADYQKKLISAEQASRNLQAAVNEYGKHMFEKPEKIETYFDDVRGTLIIGTFTDGCTTVSRAYQGRRWSKLIVDLARDPGERPSEISWLAPVATLEAAGRCWNPHPPDPPPGPPFGTWYGVRNGDWIEIWRRWRDGCQHVQMFDTRRGVWDTNPDGSPRVRWTYCAH